MIYWAGTEYFDGRRSHVYVLNVEVALETACSAAAAVTIPATRTPA